MADTSPSPSSTSKYPVPTLGHLDDAGSSLSHEASWLAALILCYYVARHIHRSFGDTDAFGAIILPITITNRSSRALNLQLCGAGVEYVTMPQQPMVPSAPSGTASLTMIPG